jgi:hypothetical protein
MRYPLDELLDKRSIIQLKIERGNNSVDKERLRKEYQDYTQAIDEFIADEICTREQIETWHSELYEANEKTWNLEDNIRKGQTGHLSLEEVGRTALAIRESNGIRVGIKAKVVSTTGIGYREIKINHASEQAIKRYNENP